MGMLCSMYKVSEEQLREFLKDSSLLEEYLNSFYENKEEYENENFLDLGKSWDALIFLLTGQTLSDAPQASLARLIFSENFIDESQDFGIGPAHYLTSKEVKFYAEKLSLLDIKKLRANYNAEQMNNLDVYPGYWEENDEFKDFLIDTYHELLAFINTAATENRAVISILS